MQYSPPIPFTNATQNNVKHPNDLKPGQEFVRLTMYTGEKDPVPSWPWPTYSTWGTAYSAGVGVTHYNLHGESPTVGKYILGPSDLYISELDALLVTCKDWIQLGAYVVAIGPSLVGGVAAWHDAGGYGGAYDGYWGGSDEGGKIVAQILGTNVIAWCAPGPPALISGTKYPDGTHTLTTVMGSPGYHPTSWDTSWIIDTVLYANGFSGGTTTLHNTYYTGAGSENLAGVTTLRYGVVNGSTAVLFDDDGVGYISYTGDWNIPFNYQRRAAGYVTCGWPINVNGWVYFVDNGGKLFKTDGSYVLEIPGPFNAKMIPEVSALTTWPDTLANAENWMQFDQTLHRLVFDVKYLDGTVKSAGLAMVNITDGGFQFLPDATNVSADAAIPRCETGGIKLVDPADRVQVAYADVDFEILGTPEAYVATPDSNTIITLTSTGNDFQTISQYQGYELVVKQSYIYGSAITFPTKHGLIDGEAVVYDSKGGAPIDPLLPHYTYYVVYVTDYIIQLSASLSALTSGTSLTLSATNAFDGTFTDGPDAYILASGRQTVRCWLNKTVERIPRFRITLNNPPAGIKCRIWGITRVAFDKAGGLP